MRGSDEIAILGGGPAGLALGYYAKKWGYSFTIYEAADRVGGNCITLEHADFFFDSGAHRFHDRDAHATREIKKLMGKELKEINIPSQIYHQDKFVDFPLSPLNLLKNLGLFTFSKAAVEVIRSRLKRSASPPYKGSGNYKNDGDEEGSHVFNTGFPCIDNNEPHPNFESFALQTYGPTLARRFLLNYSEKLWGFPCSSLSPDIAGTRMKGLNLKTFIKEALLGSKAKTEHIDGSFYYPDRGIGSICDKLAQFCGPQNIHLKSKITRAFHNNKRFQAIEINGKVKKNTPYVFSSLPLNLLLRIMEPSPPGEMLHLSKSLLYRNVILTVLFLNKNKVTKAATVYFPETDFIFTRLYEPKNRSMNMTPKGKTSLVLEIPCQQEGKLWNLGDDTIIKSVIPQLLKTGLIKEEEIIDTLVFRMKNAYPILAAGYQEKVGKILNYLQRFNNVQLSGRNGKFVYAHLHDMMKFAREIIDDA